MLTLKIKTVTIYKKFENLKINYSKPAKMKIKAYHPGMNSKLFLGLWFVLFAASILLVNWLFTNPFHQIDSLDNRLVTTEEQITNLKAINAEFLLDLNKGDYLFIHTEITAEKDAKSFISAIKQDLDYYRNLRHLRRKSDISASLHEFSNAITGIENNLNDYFLVSRERGNLNSGLVSRWQALTSMMLAVTISPGADVIHNLNLIKQFEYNYLLQKDPRILERIAVLCEETRNLIIPEEGGIDLADLDNYVSLTGNLISLDKRLGTADTRGIVADLSGSLNKSQALFDITRSMIHEAGVKQRMRLTLSRYCIILLIIAISLLLFIRITSKLIFRPLKQLAGVMQKMAAGALPENTIMPGRLSEMKSIRDSLEKLVLLLKEKIAIARALNEKRLYTEQALAGEDDLLGRELMDLQQKIIAATEQQLKIEEETHRRRYINEGLASSAKYSVQDNDINDLGDAFIRELVKYLNAIQGGFFIYDDTEKTKPVLRMVSAFAYNRKKYLQQTIAPGEGLVGTCAREKRSINLTEIPAAYISITSGLGETLPDNLLLVPVLHENVLIGVLEIASMNKYRDHEIGFAEEVARNLGSTIIYTRNNQRTAELRPSHANRHWKWRSRKKKCARIWRN
jgi:hypothetical protein